MIRRRLYNPAQLTPDELKASFVARKDTLAEMLRLLGEQMPSRPCQHVMLIGPRGMGKTTLGLRFLHAIGETPDLAASWQPVPFDEESYGIDTLADFWTTALHHLTRATGEPRWAERAAALIEDEEDAERIAAYALAALLDFCQATRKRLVLFVENLDAVFNQIRDKREDARAMRHPDRASDHSAHRVRQCGLRSPPGSRRAVLRVLPNLRSRWSRIGRRSTDSGGCRGQRRSAGSDGYPATRQRPAGDHMPADGRQSEAAGACQPITDRITARRCVRGSGEACRRADAVLQGPGSRRCLLRLERCSIVSRTDGRRCWRRKWPARRAWVPRTPVPSSSNS